MFKFTPKDKISALPTVSGVYAFKPKKGALLYIGKAINIKERVKNHFQQPTFKDNIFIPETEKIGYIATGSEIEALILEARLIKKYLPKYNTIWRDGKSHLYIFITKEEFSRIFVGHLSPKISNFQFPISKQIGPFIDGKALKTTLRLLRRIFPFRTCRVLPKKACLYKELGLCLAPCHYTGLTGVMLKKTYNQNTRRLINILQGKKPQVLNNLKKEMRVASQEQKFEKAKLLRDQIWALENVFQHSHILEEMQGTRFLSKKEPSSFGQFQKVLGLKIEIKRIEGYDISNIQGQQATGSMVVFEQGKPNKNEYRKFHIKIEGKPNDTAMLKEMISRRLRHEEWPMPQIMLIDGGKGQLNAAITALKSEARNSKSETPKESKLPTGQANPKFKILNIKTISLAKRKNELFLESKSEPVLLKNLPPETAHLILRIRDEAHRFAITYHKKLRSKNLLRLV